MKLIIGCVRVRVASKTRLTLCMLLLNINAQLAYIFRSVSYCFGLSRASPAMEIDCWLKHVMSHWDIELLGIVVELAIDWGLYQTALTGER